jgi:FHS family glucose/mannose:H+ symporter-like MFS transporter
VKSAQWFIAVGGILTFAFLGAIQALYGPLLPGLRRAFALDPAAVGLIFTAHGSGALAGILLPSLVRAQWLANCWLGLASAFLLLGASGLATAPTWPATLVAAFVLALGFGIHVVRLNGLFVVGFGARGMTMSQLINAAFSVGSILGPAVIGLLGQASPRVFGGVAILALALLPVSLVTDRKARAISAISPDREPGRSALAGRRSGSRVLLAAFVALMCLAVGVENSLAGWMTTLALADGYSFAEAANLTAGFFGAIFIGRLIAAALGHRVPAAYQVIAAIAFIAVMLSIAVVTQVGPVAFVLAGFGIAPIFAATLVWLGSALPTSPHANTIVIAGALLGSAVLPALVGRAVAQFGPAAAPPAILCIALAALGLALWVELARR